MSLARVAGLHYRQQAALARGLERRARTLWARMDAGDLDRSWRAIADELFVQVSSGQLLAASTAQAYTAAALTEQGADPDARGTVVPQAFAGVASDGRDLEPLLYSSVTRTKEAIGSGWPVPSALRSGGETLAMIVATQVADLGRAAAGAATVAHYGATGWVRMLNPPSCSRCAVLAGKFFRTNQGFQRHPHCDCIHVPAADAAGVADVRTDPSGYFGSLSPAEQDRYFTKAGAQAIRDGADLGQVVNARRGAWGMTTPGRFTADEQALLRGGRGRGQLQRRDVYGRQVYVTSEGVTTRGLAGQRLGASETGVKDGGRYRSARTPRLMPESIYDLAGGDRDEAVRLLKRFGYLI